MRERGHERMTRMDFSGVWDCRYWYPSNKGEGEEVSEYEVKIHQIGNQLVIESLPNEEESYLSARLILDGDAVTGTWQENTSLSGEFAGSIYSGAMYLLINKDCDCLTGKWVGIGQESGKKKVYAGRWEITRKE